MFPSRLNFRYRNEVYDDDDMMESNFQTVMREEAISKKIGRMEDLEDIRREEEELKLKAQMRKNKKKMKKFWDIQIYIINLIYYWLFDSFLKFVTW